MITITKKLKIGNAVFPATVEFIDNASSSCVVLPAPMTITTASFTATFQFEDEQCITASSIFAKVKDAEGCESSLLIPLTNPCTNFQLSQIQYNGNLSFSVSTTNAKAPVFYDWEWDTLLFSRDITTPQSVLHLRPGTTLQGIPYTFIKCTAYDGYGCSKSTEIQFQLCVPTAGNTSVSLYCAPNYATSLNSGFTVPATSCSEFPLDWTTLEFINLPTGVTYQITSPGIMNLQVDTSDVAPGTYLYGYVISNTLGLTSSIGYIQVHVPSCIVPPNIEILPKVVVLPCPPQLGYVTDINLHDLVNSFAPIDWSTLQFIPLPGQALVNQYQLQSVSGIANLTLGEHMTYQVNSVNTGNDIIQWSVCNELGACQIGTITFVYQCFVPPIANADSICAVCCQATPYIDLTTNDIGPLNPETLVIVQFPLHGSVTVNSQGLVSYTADCNYEGSDMFSYQVFNSLTGNASNVAVVAVDVVCAGTSIALTLCD